MAKRDYYEVLGVDRSADDATLKSAFRKLAMQYHPDRNAEAGAEEKFKEASEAYEILCDADKRARYDRVGHPGVEGFSGGGGFGGNVNINDIFGEIFGDIFGGRGGRQRQARNRGADLRYNLEISFEEAAFGAEVTVKIPRPKRCEECAGTGSKSKQTRQCPTCGGAGEVRFTQGFFAVSRACSQCSGSGNVVSDPCKNCKGSGKLDSETSLQVKIPGGVDTGTRVRLAGEGEVGEHGGPAGDLYVVVHVRPHAIFGRKGARDLTVHVPITFAEATLGAHVKVPTLADPVTLKVKAGTQPGTTQKVKGRGVAGTNGHAGDLFVTFDLAIPHKLDHDQRTAVEAVATAFPDDPRAEMGVE